MGKPTLQGREAPEPKVRAESRHDALPVDVAAKIRDSVTRAERPGESKRPPSAGGRGIPVRPWLILSPRQKTGDAL